MEISVSDLIDRLTILTLKRERLNGNEYQEEYEKYHKEFRRLVNLKDWKSELWWELYEANRQIWEAEAEIGKHALEVRRWNKKRQEIKNEISGLYGGFQDTKDYYKNL